MEIFKLILFIKLDNGLASSSNDSSLMDDGKKDDDDEDDKDKSKKKNRCAMCRKKVGLTGKVKVNIYCNDQKIF